jgi:NitT/TauT family transport system permease protein
MAVLLITGLGVLLYLLVLLLERLFITQDARIQ